MSTNPHSRAPKPSGALPQTSRRCCNNKGERIWNIYVQKSHMGVICLGSEYFRPYCIQTMIYLDRFCVSEPTESIRKKKYCGLAETKIAAGAGGGGI